MCGRAISSIFLHINIPGAGGLTHLDCAPSVIPACVCHHRRGAAAASRQQQPGGVAWRHNPRRSEMDTATRRSWRQVCTRAPGRRSVVGSVPTSSSQQAAHDTSSAAPDFMQPGPHTHRLWCEPAPQLSAVSIVLISPDISSALTLCPAVFAVPALQQLQYLQCRAGQVAAGRAGHPRYDLHFRPGPEQLIL